MGSNVVFRTTNGGISWTPISPDLTRHDPRTLGASGGPITKDQTSVEYHHDFRSRFLPHARTVCVWLPPGYGAHRDRRYPVLYLHDGQNLFDAHTAFGGNPWGADEVAECEVRAGRVPPLILVGVANTPDRLHEYGPQRCGRGRAHDRSRAYGRFLVEEVRPLIDALYRTRPEPECTGVGGSSSARRSPSRRPRTGGWRSSSPSSRTR